MTRRARALLLAAALLVAGCNATRVAYENADTLLRWRVASYVNVRAEQAEALDRDIARLLAWHRTYALPQYSRLAEESATRMARGLSREDLFWGYDSLRAQLRESALAAAAQAADLLDRLSPGQIAYLQERLHEDNRKFAKEQLAGTPKERRARRCERDLARLEDWLGALTDEQAELVRQYSERVPLEVDELRDRRRRRLQAEFMDIVRARQAKGRLAGFAAKIVPPSDDALDPAYAGALRAATATYFDMLLELDRGLTPRQRSRAVARLRSLASDFSQLAQAGAGAGGAQ